jgi:hypothetical protein
MKTFRIVNDLCEKEVLSMDDGPCSHNSKIELLTVLMPEQMRAYPLTSSPLI